MHIHIELEGTPPTGTVHPPGRADDPQRFVGWLGLLRALSALAENQPRGPREGA